MKIPVFRYRLQTLMIALTMGCAILGIWRLRLDMHYRAVTSLERRGVTIDYEHRFESARQFLAQCAVNQGAIPQSSVPELSWYGKLTAYYPKEFAYVRSVYFNDTDVSEEDRLALRYFTRLKVIRVGGQNLTGDELNRFLDGKNG